MSSDKLRKNLLVICVLSVAAGLWLFNPSGLYFLADDFIHIPESATKILVQRNSFRPVGNLSLHLDYLLSGTSPFGYHLTNLLLHIINSILVFVLVHVLCRIYKGQQNQNILPLLSSVLFFIYPFHSEAIFWIIGRSGSLGAIFFLSAIILYLYRTKHLLYFLSSLTAFLIALLSYESSWIFPLLAIVIALIDKFYLTSKTKDTIHIGCVFLVFTAFLFWRYTAIHQVLNEYESAAFLHLNFSDLTLNYFRLLLRSIVPPSAVLKNLIIAFVAVLTIAGAMFIAAFRKNRTGPLFFLMLICLIISYLPYLSLGIDLHGVEGERYLYLPSVFLCVLMAYLILTLKNNYVFIVFALVFSLNLYFLSEARSCYKIAGIRSKTTIEEINKVPSDKKIFFENLPQNYKGAIIFRLGFAEAVKWLLPESRQEFIVISVDDTDAKDKDRYHNNFIVEYKNDTTAIGTSSFSQDHSGIYSFNQTGKTHSSFVYEPSTDAWFRYSDSSLLIIK